MKYKNIKRDFNSRYIGKVVKKDEIIELDRDLKGIELGYLVPVEEKKKEIKKEIKEDEE